MVLLEIKTKLTHNEKVDATLPSLFIERGRG
jgi:hypothetical protein